MTDSKEKTETADRNEASDLIESKSIYGNVFFYATSGRMCYEIHLDGMIAYEPRAKEVLTFPLGLCTLIRIRGLLFGKDGLLNNSRELGKFICPSADGGLFILCNEKRAVLVSKEDFLKTIIK